MVDFRIVSARSWFFAYHLIEYRNDVSLICIVWIGVFRITATAFIVILLQCIRITLSSAGLIFEQRLYVCEWMIEYGKADRNVSPLPPICLPPFYCALCSTCHSLIVTQSLQHFFSTLVVKFLLRRHTSQCYYMALFQLCVLRFHLSQSQIIRFIN